jgi:hypothetical protein
MTGILKPYDGDKRKREYKEYLTQWSTKLGLLNKDKNIREEVILLEERTPEDYFKIIMYLGKLMPINDIVRNIVENVLVNEPLSTRGWYMNVYHLLRENKLSKIIMSWQMSSKPTMRLNIIRNTMNLPDSNYRKELMRNLRTKTVWNPRTMNVHKWIKYDKEYDKEYETVSWINSPKDLDIHKDNETKLYTTDQPTHFYRLLDHAFEEPPKKVHWTKFGESWVKSVSCSVYMPYRIKWELCRDCKFSKKFIEDNRKKITLKSYGMYKLSPLSPWIRIECGNRHYYRNKETDKKMKEEPLEGFSNVNITDIYYFDRNVPVI